MYFRTIPNTVAGDNVDHSNMFPPQDEFAQFPVNSNNQENLFITLRSTPGSMKRSS